MHTTTMFLVRSIHKITIMPYLRTRGDFRLSVILGLRPYKLEFSFRFVTAFCHVSFFFSFFFFYAVPTFDRKTQRTRMLVYFNQFPADVIF